MNIKQLKAQVENILKVYPDTRNSDRKLMFKVWQEFYGVGDLVTLARFMELPSPESVRRIRQKLTEKGNYLPTDWEVAKRRKILKSEWELALGYNPIEGAPARHAADAEIRKQVGLGIDLSSEGRRA